MLKYFAFFLLFFLNVSNFFGQIEEIRRITKTLCSEDFDGRGYVNKGDLKAGKFIANEFKRIGIKSFKHSYFQKFPLSVNTFPASMDVKIGDKTLLPGVHYMVNPSSGSADKILYPKLLASKILVNQELLSREIRDILQGKSTINAIAINLKGVSPDTLKWIISSAEQIAALVPVIEVTDKKFTWSVGRNQLKNVFIHVQDSIFKDSSSWSLNIASTFIEKYESKNVIAYLPSKQKNAKTIVFTAHYDHLGRMGEKTYFPGANDNASGTAMLLSMATYFKENSSNCNILFIAFAGEEAGLVGSEYFVNNPIIPLNKIDFLINLDIMGSGEEGITVVNATNYPNEFDRLTKINDENKLLTQIKKRGPAKNSDHYWFTTKNVPSFFIYTQGLNKNYHDVFDTYENLSFIEYKDIITLLVKFVESF